MIGQETIEQIKIIEWCKQNHPDLPVMSIANERKCNPFYGKILKRMGLCKGASDLFFPRGSCPSFFYKGLFLEVKKFGVGKLSEAQKEFIKKMEREDYRAQVVYSADEAILFLKEFYGL